MHASRPFSTMFLFGLGALSLADAAAYTSQEIGPAATRQYIDLNNNQYALTMRQSAPGQQNLHIVIENLNPGYYSEFRPGTLPGTTRSVAMDFNDSQAIVGYAETLDANGNATAPNRAFLFSNGAFIDLSALPPLNTSGNVESRALGINNLGDVVGFWRDSTGRRHGFLYSNGTITDLGAFNPNGLGGTEARAVNDLRQITGYSFSVPGAQQSSAHAFLYSQGSMQDLHPYTYGLQSLGQKINSRGEAIGVGKPSTHSQDCFIYTGGAVRMIPTLGRSGEPFCSLSSINNAGVVVGQSTTAVYPPNFLTSVAFVYSNGQSADLNSLINPSDSLAVNRIGLSDALAINDTGHIIVRGGASYYLLKPDSVTNQTDSAHYHFEYTTHSWYNEGQPIASITSSTTQKFAGSASLAVQFNGSGFVSVGAMYPPLLAGKTVAFHLYLPANATIDWVQPFVLEDYAGGWAWHGNWQLVSNLQRGAWNTITVNVPASAQPAWRLGVEFYTSQPYNGTVFIDSVGF
ncbi:MAG: hypothetical protein H7Y02_04085 [Candidatus Obscuribacterales bacterium]|nr:hypothetical protein [Steroidobacteraceae bacterium]